MESSRYACAPSNDCCAHKSFRGGDSVRGLEHRSRVLLTNTAAKVRIILIRTKKKEEKSYSICFYRLLDGAGTGAANRTEQSNGSASIKHLRYQRGQET